MLKHLDGSTDSSDAFTKQSPASESWSLSRLACDYVPPLAAAVSGTVAFGNTVSRVGFSKGLLLAGAVGSVARTSTKALLEQCLLDPKDRTLSVCDISEGALNGLSGVFGSLAEKEFSLLYTYRKGIADGYTASAATLAGEQIVSQTWEKIKHNFWRGTVGGAAAAVTDTIPKSLYYNKDALLQDFPTGVNNVGRDLVQNSFLGAAFGGVISGAGTTLWNSRNLLKMGQHFVAGAETNTRLRLVHINDWHSELSGPRSLSRAVTINNQLRALSEKQGISHITVSCGDEYSGNAAAAYTEGGLVENEILAKHLKIDNRLDGNHQFDTNRGDYDLPRHFDNMNQLRLRYPRVSTLAANLDHSAYPEYKKLMEPYRIHTINGPTGPQQLGIIGLSTQEGAQGMIKYLDPGQTALKYIRELQQKGVKNIGLMTHLGFSEDIKLARFLAEALPANQRPKFIVGGHSHDFTATPQIENGIPIAHAGSNGRYVGEIDLSIRADGSLDLIQTRGRMHHLNNMVTPDSAAQVEIDGHLKEFHKLGNQGYNVKVTSPYSVANIRSQETPLGNLTTDATMAGLTDYHPDLVINHSGGIRAGLVADETVTRRELSNIFINSGIRESEKGELVMCHMSGLQVKEALEYGLQDLVMPGVGKPNLSTRILNALRRPSLDSHADKPGNFCQISGGTYSFDLAKPARIPGVESTGRLVEVNIKSPVDGSLKPLKDDAIYKVVTRYHPLDKWHQYGVMGDVSKKDFYAHVQACTVPESQVDLLGNYIEGRSLDPKTFSGVDGRIKDLTAYAAQSQLYPGWSAVSTAVMPSSCDPSKSHLSSVTSKLDKQI